MPPIARRILEETLKEALRVVIPQTVMSPEEFIENLRIALLRPTPPVVSTTHLLGSNEEFLSDWISSEQYTKLVGTIYSDADGTLYVEESQDKVSIDGVEVLNYRAGTRTPFLVELVAPFFRVRYRNGPVPQSEFKLVLRLRGL